MVTVADQAASMFGIGGGGGIWSGLGWIGATIFVGLSILGVTWYVLEQKKYNKSVAIKRLYSGNQGRYFFDTAKRWVDPDGVEYWWLKGLKRAVTVPPEESMGIKTDGTTIAWGVIDSNGQFTWISHDFDFDAYKKGTPRTEKIEVTNPKTGKVTEVEKQVEAYTAKYEPITTESKANWARQQTINKKMRIGNWWKEHGSQAVAGITLVMLVFSFLLFAPKGVETMTEFSQQQERVAAQQTQTMQQMDEILVTVNRMLENANNRENAGTNPIPSPGNETEAPN